jgi:citrate synthase
MSMMENIKKNVLNWNDDDEIEKYLLKILNKEAFDMSGLIYGLGHAVYTISDPRAEILRERAKVLAKEKNRLEEFALYESVERIAKKVLSAKKGDAKNICANVDFYSGFVYDMLGIPSELYTPLFAVSRIAGWCAHFTEEVLGVQKIIRPAYKSISSAKQYVPLHER